MTRGSPLGERVYVRLRAALLDGTRPVTERLTESKLARELGVSRTPVREALTRLVSDGLVRREDYGYSVVLPSLATLRDLHEVAVAVELRGIERCLENPALRHDADALRRELARWYALREAPAPAPAEFVCHDERFHTTLLAASGNTELVAALTAVHGRTRHARIHFGPLAEHPETAIGEHIAIAERLLGGELEAARELLHRHLEAAVPPRLR